MQCVCEGRGGLIKLIVFWGQAFFFKSSSILRILRMTLAFEHHFNLDVIWSAPCIDVHTIIHRSLLLTS